MNRPPVVPGAMSAQPKKAFGQHFLVSTHHARRIAEAIPAGRTEPVLEIGAGRGALSVFLQKRFPSFHVLEMDRDLIPALRQNLGEGPWTLHHGNVLDFDFKSIGFPLHVAGNLPYNIAALIIKRVLLCGGRIASATFMVQREVAERIVAQPHSKRMGYLSVFCQFFGKPKILFHVPPGAFSPRPDVESSVFQLVIDPDVEKKLEAGRWPEFFAFADKGFSQRRKMMVNSLSKTCPKALVLSCLGDTGISATARAEDLSVEEWVRLFRRVCDVLDHRFLAY
jgi:16S rRNA (adenine1518-N6/adenine1519-N6)-dimethyltransferase